jgi:hypothetical protein
LAQHGRACRGGHAASPPSCPRAAMKAKAFSRSRRRRWAAGRLLWSTGPRSRRSGGQFRSSHSGSPLLTIYCALNETIPKTPFQVRFAIEKATRQNQAKRPAAPKIPLRSPLRGWERRRVASPCEEIRRGKAEGDHSESGPGAVDQQSSVATLPQWRAPCQGWGSVPEHS